MLGAASLNIFSSPPPVPPNHNNAINRIPSLPVTPFRKRVGKEEENCRKQGGNEEEQAGRGGNGKGKGKQVYKHKGWYTTKVGEEKGVTIGEEGVAYKVAGAPFEFKFSYSETPRVKPLALREPPYVPFARQDFARPWTGRAPLSKSKKMLPKLHSSRPVKPLSPFLMVNGPNYRAPTREEILGEPLTKEEKQQLLLKSIRCTRQVNLGRDGLTHNMLELIHTHWKRQQVCKIKCKGVPTVDMENVCHNLEEKTGGKIIYRHGGVAHLFRGRNYNYKSRPRFPLMLWKPATPVYPKLILRAPEGLTVEEADALRRKARHLPAICKLGKNGVYLSLVRDIRDAFEETELVRINCHGMKPTDYKRIGAKLKELVPCVLLSFDKEHILMWRGKEYKVKNPRKSVPVHSAYGSECVSDDSTNSRVADIPLPDQIVCTKLGQSTNLNKELVKQSVSSSKDTSLEDDMTTNKCREPLEDESSKLHISMQPIDFLASVEKDRYGIDNSRDETDIMVKDSSGFANASKRSEVVHASGRECQSNGTRVTEYTGGNLSTDDTTVTVNSSEILSESVHFPSTGDKVFNAKCMETAGNDNLDLLKLDCPKLNHMHVVGYESEDRDTKEKGSLTTKEDNECSKTASIESLWQQAVESRLALLLDGPCLDPDGIMENYVNSAQTAPSGPDIKHKHALSARKDRRHRKKSAKDERNQSEGKKTYQHINSKQVEEILPSSDKVPPGMLPLDDLAKLLLAP